MRRLSVAFAVALGVPSSAAAAPAPAVVASATKGPAPLTVRFSANDESDSVVPGPAVASYAWRFGDGTTGSGQTVVHRYAKPGRYTATVTATDALGADGAASVEVSAEGLSLAFTRPAVVFGTRAVARGALVPAEAGVRVVLERRDGGAWRFMRSSRTDWAGRFVAGVRPARSGVWRARAADVRSTPAQLDVSPQLSAQAGTGTAFVGAPLVVRARPRTTARLLVTVLRDGREVAQVRGAADARLIVPTPGVGAFTARIELDGNAMSVPLHAAARTLSYGSTGQDVRRAPHPARAASRPRPGAVDDASARSSSTASSPSRRRAGSTGPAPSTTRPGVRSRRTSSRRRATAARGRTSRSRRAGRS